MLPIPESQAVRGNASCPQHRGSACFFRGEFHLSVNLAASVFPLCPQDLLTGVADPEKKAQCELILHPRKASWWNRL